MIFKKKTKVATLTVLLLAVAICVLLLNRNREAISETSATTVQERTPLGIHRQAFWDEQLFNVAMAKATSPAQEKPVLGAIIPHHLIANHMIIDVLKRLQKKPPQHVVLITPNHYEEGSTAAITSDWDWETPFGTYKTNSEIVQTLTESQLISINHDALAKEHAIAGLVHYFQFFLPDSLVIPIAVSNTLRLHEIQALSELLKNELPKDAVIITSVDFSHYLSSEESDKRDKVSLSAIEKADYSQILTFSNEYVDSPSAVVVHLLLMNEKKVVMRNIENTNSGTLLGDPHTEGTSYFELIWE